MKVFILFIVILYIPTSVFILSVNNVASKCCKSPGKVKSDVIYTTSWFSKETFSEEFLKRKSFSPSAKNIVIIW